MLYNLVKNGKSLLINIKQFKKINYSGLLLFSSGIVKNPKRITKKKKFLNRVSGVCETAFCPDTLISFKILIFLPYVRNR